MSWSSDNTEDLNLIKALSQLNKGLSRYLLSPEDKTLLESVRKQLMDLDPNEAKKLEIVLWLGKLGDDLYATDKCIVHFMSDENEKELHEDQSLIKEGNLYVKESGDYITRYNNQVHSGSLLTGDNSDPEIDLKDLSEKLSNKEFIDPIIHKILEVTSSRDHTGENRNQLMFAAQAGKADVIKVLKALGLQLHHRDMWGNTALILAAREGHLEATQLLKELGIDVNATDNYGLSALMQAARDGKLEIVQWLVEHGADLTLKGEHDCTALSLAEEMGHEDVSTYLEEAFDKKYGITAELIQLRRLLKKPDLTQEEEQLMHGLLTTNLHPDVLVSFDKVPALVYALKNKNIKAAKILTAHNADKACLSVIQSPYGETLWSALVINKTLTDADKDVIHFLCDNDLDQFAGIEMARRNRNIEMLQIINAHQIHHLLAEEIKDKKEAKNITDVIQKRLETMNTIKKAGHVLGFTCSISNVKSNGYSSFESYCMFQNYLNHLTSNTTSPTPEWLKKYYSPQDAPLRQSLNLAINWLKADEKITHEDFILNHAAGKPTFLPIYYPGHAFTLIAWNDVLIVCNRGENQLKHFISVFKIPDPGKITEKFLQAIMPETEQPLATQVMQGIRDFVGLENLERPILTFSSHEQKHGNCSFVNLKSSMKPMLCFLELFQSDPQAVKFDSAFLEPYLPNGPLASTLDTVIENAGIEYKKFTTEMRNQEVDKLCTTFSALTPGSPDRKIYLEIFEAFLKEHHGQYLSSHDNTKRAQKMNIERRRAEQILNLQAMSESEKKKILTTIFFAEPLKSEEDIQWLTAQGVDLNAKNQDGCTPLNARDKDGYTPLIRAVIHEQLDIIQRLGALGADLDAKDKLGYTALMWATLLKKENIVSLLKEIDQKRVTKEVTDLMPTPEAGVLLPSDKPETNLADNTLENEGSPVFTPMRIHMHGATENSQQTEDPKLKGKPSITGKGDS